MLLAILSIVILIFSVILHEVSHGYMADYLGDPTARLAGRLTLNPLKHIDPVGSIIVPLATYLFGGFTFGWAKPVPFNPYNLKNRRQGEFLIAIAGPASNLLLALVFGLILRFTVTADASGALIATPFIEILITIVLINIVLAVFNLIPIPPLDGSKLFLAFLPNQYGKVRRTLEQFGPFFVLIVAFVLWQVIYPVIPWIFSLITGIGL